MFRRSIPFNVHFFSSLVPKIVLDRGAATTSFDTEALDAAKLAIGERENILNGIDLLTPLTAVADPESLKDVHSKRRTVKQFNDCVDSLRAVLYQKNCADPLKRLQIHEAIMAAGYYQRTISPTELAGEHTRFVLNHYNFDVRRDTAITQMIHKSLLKDKVISTDSEKLLRDILLLERCLYGIYRFAPTSGHRWLVLGMKLSDVDSEAELNRIMGLPVVREDGNFILTENDTEKLWKTMKLVPGAESQCSFAEASGLYKNFSENSKELSLELRIQKPVPPMEFWDRVKDTLLRYWVIWFSLWVMFFMVDEEIITLVALIVLKWKQTAILEEEAKRTGGKVYIASSVGRSI